MITLVEYVVGAAHPGPNIVSILQLILAGHHVYIDCRTFVHQNLTMASEFDIDQMLKASGYGDVSTEPLPVKRKMEGGGL